MHEYFIDLTKQTHKDNAVLALDSLDQHQFTNTLLYAIAERLERIAELMETKYNTDVQKIKDKAVENAYRSS